MTTRAEKRRELIAQQQAQQDQWRASKEVSVWHYLAGYWVRVDEWGCTRACVRHLGETSPEWQRRGRLPGWYSFGSVGMVELGPFATAEEAKAAQDAVCVADSWKLT